MLFFFRPSFAILFFSRIAPFIAIRRWPSLVFLVFALILHLLEKLWATQRRCFKMMFVITRCFSGESERCGIKWITFQLGAHHLMDKRSRKIKNCFKNPQGKSSTEHKSFISLLSSINDTSLEAKSFSIPNWQSLIFTPEKVTRNFQIIFHYFSIVSLPTPAVAARQIS